MEYFREFAAFRHIPLQGIANMMVGMDHLHATGIPLACENTRQYGLKMMTEARKAGMSISFDPNLRPNLWPSKKEMIRVTNEAAALSDWFLPGIHEGQLLTGLQDPEAIADFTYSAASNSSSSNLAVRARSSRTVRGTLK